MHNSTNLDMFEEKVKASLNDNIDTPSGTQLTSMKETVFRKLPSYQPQPKMYQKFGTRVFASIFILLFVFTLVVGPQRVLAELQSLFSFIPGVGVVESSNTAMLLSEPLQYEQDGVIYTIETFYASADETILSYRIENLPAQANQEYIQQIMADNPNLVNPQETVRDGRKSVYLILPNGQRSQALHRNNTSIGLGNTVWAEQLRYPALPAGTDQLRVLFVQIPTMAKGIAPENVQLEINLRPAEAGDISPVFLPEIVLTEEPQETNNISESPLDLIELNIDGLSMVLGDLVLQVSVSLDDDPDYMIDLLIDSVRLEDALGNNLPLTYSYGENDSILNHGQYIFKSSSFDFENTAQPLSLKADNIELFVPDHHVFTFQKPEDITYGECKLESIEFSLINGTPFQIDEVCLDYELNSDDLPEYNIRFLQHSHVIDSFQYGMLSDKTCEGIKLMFSDYCGGGGAGGGGTQEEVSSEYTLSYWTEPQFPIEVISSYSIQIAGSWEVLFDLPEGIATNPVQSDDNQVVVATAIPYEPVEPVSEYDEILDQMRTMLTNYGNQFLDTGWVYMFEKQINSHTPEHPFFYKTWFNFDEENVLLARYGQGYDHNDILKFQNYYSNGIGANLSVLEFDQMEAYPVDYYDDSAPLAFSSIVKSFEQKIYTESYSLIVEEGQHKGQDVLIFKVTSPLQVPYHCDNNGECWVVNSAYLDADTGRLIATDTYQIFPEGDQTISHGSVTEIEIFEAQSNPPLEILNEIRTRAEEIIGTGTRAPVDDGNSGGGGN